ncbi:MAG: GDSL-type esterase/lipase family protein [Myxococcales bacterium]
MTSEPRDVRICFFGDSLTNGVQDSTYMGWTGRLCAALPLQVTHYNLGVRGHTALDIERRWEAESSQRWKPGTERRLVFTFGTNDCSLESGVPRLPLAESVASAERILAQAIACCPVLFIGPPALELEDHASAFARLGELSKAYARLAERLEVPYFDLFEHTRASSDWFGAVQRGDGIHPEHTGYALWANMIATWDAWRAWW